MTTPTADPFEAVNAFLRQDFGTYDQLSAKLDSAALGRAMATAFFLAADRLFGDQTKNAVVAFVARARQRFDPDDNIDPQAAERLIRAAAFEEENLVDGIDQHTMGRVQPMMLAAMVYEANWSEAELEDFISEARSIMAQQ